MNEPNLSLEEISFDLGKQLFRNLAGRNIDEGALGVILIALAHKIYHKTKHYDFHKPDRNLEVEIEEVFLTPFDNRMRAFEKAAKLMPKEENEFPHCVSNMFTQYLSLLSSLWNVGQVTEKTAISSFKQSVFSLFTLMDLDKKEREREQDESKLDSVSLSWRNAQRIDLERLGANTKTVVYFISNGEAIKIGYATKLKNRFSGIQTGSHLPVTIIGTMRGGRNLEGHLHARFAKYRLQGEWFKECLPIIEFVNAYADKP